MIPDSCFVADNATIVGDVVMGDNCSIWFNAVLRGDVHEIRMGCEVNIQDGAVLHGTYEKHGTYLGDRVSVGHHAIVHGCRIESDVLIGMGAIVMDGCVVNSHCIIAAGSVVTQGTVVPSGSIFAGVPAKLVKQLDASEFASEIMRIATNYKMYAGWFKADN